MHSFKKNIFLISLTLILLSGGVSYSQTDISGAIPKNITTVNQFASWFHNEFDYVLEIPNEPKTIEETLATKTGDCDDFAQLVSYFLANIFSMENQIVIIKYRGLKLRHAICVWQNPDGKLSFSTNTSFFETDTGTIEGLLDAYYPDWEKIGITRSDTGKTFTKTNKKK